MKTYTLVITIVFLLLFSCNKETIDIDLTPIDQQRLVVEGLLTDSLQHQTFTMTWTQRLGSQIPVYASEVDLFIETPTGTQPFQEIGPGTYQSLNPFKGEYGENYRIEFKKDGLTHFRNIKMPQPIEIVHTVFQEFDSISNFSGRLSLGFYMSSPLEQYLHFKIESASPNPMAIDTAWTSYALPIYRVAKIPAGDSVFVSLPIEQNDLIEAYDEMLLRVELKVITVEVAEYLLNLKNYSTNATQEGKLLNPPYYYSNEAYGLGYGTIMYEIIHQY